MQMTIETSILLGHVDISVQGVAKRIILTSNK